MFSYIFQFTSLLLLGPVVYFILLFRKVLGDKVCQYLEMIKNELALEINVSNTTVMLALMIAAVVRISQSPPVFELDFLIYLVWLQWLMALARVTMSLANADDDNIWECVYILAVTVLAFFAACVVGFSAYPGGAQGTALKDLSRFCTYENSLALPIDDIASSIISSIATLSSTTEATWTTATAVISNTIMTTDSAMTTGTVLNPLKHVSHGTFWALPRAMVTVVIDIIWMIIQVIWYIAPYAAILYGAVVVLIILAQIPWITFPSAWIAVCIYLLVMMQKARSDLEKALGQNYQDTKWSFGQITAVIMWLPTIATIFRKLICK
jgi:hypothetical protein